MVQDKMKWTNIVRKALVFEGPCIQNDIYKEDMQGWDEMQGVFIMDKLNCIQNMFALLIALK